MSERYFGASCDQTELMAEPLHLRPVRESELAGLLELFVGSPSQTGEFQWFGYLPMARAKELERRWQDDGLIHQEKPSFLAVALEDDTCIGWVSWRPAGPVPMWSFEIGASLFAEHRGRGLGTEAQRQLVAYLFSTTPAHRLQAGTELGNVAEQRALERIGFRREGVARGYNFRAGQWRDGVLYGLLRTDP